jgi:hypothetical protein
LLALDQASGCQKPLECLDPHESIVIEHRQVLNLELGFFEGPTRPLGDHVHDIYLDALMGKFLLEQFQRHFSLNLPLLEKGELFDDLVFIEVLSRDFDLNFIAFEEETSEES